MTISNLCQSILANDSSMWNKIVIGRFYNTIGHGEWYYFSTEKIVIETELVDVKYNGVVFYEVDMEFKDFYHSELQDLNGHGHIKIIDDTEFRASSFNDIFVNYLRSTFSLLNDNCTPSDSFFARELLEISRAFRP